MSQIMFDENPTANRHGSKPPLKCLVARVVTLVSLAVSIAVLKTNKDPRDGWNQITYSHYLSYRYMMYAMVLGVVYTVLQIPFAVYYMKTKKFMINSIVSVKFNFYADMVILLLLTLGAGAGFGMTVDLKRAYDTSHETGTGALETYFSINYVPAAFCLVACFASAVSSVHSALALSKLG